MLILVLFLTVALCLGVPFHKLVISIFEYEIDRVNRAKDVPSPEASVSQIRFVKNPLAFMFIMTTMVVVIIIMVVMVVVMVVVIIVMVVMIIIKSS